MKKYLVCLILLLGLPVLSEENVTKKDAYKALNDSNLYQQKVCSNIVKNFRRDNQFSTYMKNRCILFEADRQRQSAIIFPYPNSREAGYNANYPIIMSAYIVNLNKQEIENYKKIINEYCKHNIYRISKKMPSVCTQETINRLF